ncbi:hypothetical protein B0H16DRAFT_1697766 [Mycena metata]|uniref:Uncharacterized protein n=1 Tax=Mycena metata TaxID=1033252 RepID=A0AAD7HS70_9AGAR|nr:hypothetical protein B0H16DRAFT_1697766 [Mycena metata]
MSNEGSEVSSISTPRGGSTQPGRERPYTTAPDCLRQAFGGGSATETNTSLMPSSAKCFLETSRADAASTRYRTCPSLLKGPRTTEDVGKRQAVAFDEGDWKVGPLRHHHVEGLRDSGSGEGRVLVGNRTKFNKLSPTGGSASLSASPIMPQAFTSTVLFTATLAQIGDYRETIARKEAQTRALLEEVTSLGDQLLFLRNKEREYRASLSAVHRKRKREDDHEEQSTRPAKQHQPSGSSSRVGPILVRNAPVGAQEERFVQYALREARLARKGLVYRTHFVSRPVVLFRGALYSSRRHRGKRATAAPDVPPTPPSPSTQLDKKLADARSLVDARDEAQGALSDLNERVNEEQRSLIQSAAELKDADARASSNLRAAQTSRDSKLAQVEEKEAIVDALVAELGEEMGPGWVDSLGRDTKKQRPALPARMEGVRGGNIKGYITRPSAEAGPSKRKLRGGEGHKDAVPEPCEIGGG